MPSSPSLCRSVSVEPLERRRLLAGAPALAGLTLIDSSKQMVVGALTSGITVNMTEPGVTISVRADPQAGATVGSVRFVVDGTPFSVENFAPYAIAGNGANDSYLPWNVSAGTHTLSAVPYSGAQTTGTAGPAATVTFSVLKATSPAPVPTPTPPPPAPNPALPAAVASIQVLNAVNGQVVGTLANGSDVDLTGSKQAGLRVNLAGGSTKESVRFELDGQVVRMENTAPYTITDAKAGGGYVAWSPSAGQHTMRVTSFAGKNASGASASVTVTFTVQRSTPAPTPPTPTNPQDPTASVQRETGRHQEFLNRIQQGPIDLLFLGDSITDWFDSTGQSVYNANYSQHRPANFGVAGDKTQNVIWRITNGELDGINPKVLVLMIGTNNLAEATDSKIADGIKKIVQIIRGKLPSTKVLLMGILPRGEASDPRRARIQNINSMIDDLDDGGQHVKFLDIGRHYLDSNNQLRTDLLYDNLHPSNKGYQVWADAMRPTLLSLL